MTNEAKPKHEWELAWEKTFPELAKLHAKDELREARQWERAGFKYGYLAKTDAVLAPANLLPRNGGANIPPEQLPKPIKLWCNAHSAKLKRIHKALNNGQPTREEYSGYDQNLFEYYGCRTFEE